MSAFTFYPCWKEELVCTGAGGSFSLEYYFIRKTTVHLPTEDIWRIRGPQWAQDFWPELKSDLQTWCVENKTSLIIDESASVFPVN